jgi:hypothetical protein
MRNQTFSSGGEGRVRGDKKRNSKFKKKKAKLQIKIKNLRPIDTNIGIF